MKTYTKKSEQISKVRSEISAAIYWCQQQQDYEFPKELKEFIEPLEYLLKHCVNLQERYVQKEKQAWEKAQQ